jgi:hypothetical protein
MFMGRRIGEGRRKGKSKGGAAGGKFRLPVIGEKVLLAGDLSHNKLKIKYLH